MGPGPARQLPANDKGVDERAIRRFINGERPVSDALLGDTAEALRELIAEATAAVGQISTILIRAK